MNILNHFSFQFSKFVVKTVNLSLVPNEHHHLVEFSPVMIVSFQRAKRGVSYTHYFIGVLAYVVISKHFIWKSFFTFKDELPQMILSGLHKYLSVASVMLPVIVKPNAILKTKFVNIQVFHISLEKKVKIGNIELTAIQEHLLRCNYFPSLENFSILTRESNDFKLKIMGSLLLVRHKPVLNKANSSLPFEQ